MWVDVILSTVSSLSLFEADITDFGTDYLETKIDLAKSLLSSEINKQVDNLELIVSSSSLFNIASDYKVLSLCYFDRFSSPNDKWHLKYEIYEAKFRDEMNKALKSVSVDGERLTARQGRVFR